MSESRLLARRAALVLVGTFASRVLGLGRDVVVAAMFSLSSTDAFFIAFTIPNTLRVLLGEGAITNAFVPIFTDVRTHQGEEAGRRFLSRFSVTLGGLLLITTVLGVLGAPWIALGYAGGLRDRPEDFALVVDLTRLLFPMLFLAGVAALCTGALNVLGQFTLPALAPALQNAAMIAGPLLFASSLAAAGYDPVLSIAFGALAGGVLQILAQLPSMRAARVLPRPELQLGDPNVKRALGLIAPMTVGFGVYQLNMLLSRLFASFLPTGAQSYLNYGQRVIEIPQGMFALAVASAALPTLARLRSEGKREEMLSLFRDSLRLTMFIAVPASVALFALSEPTAATLFARGKFGPEQIVETGRSLAIQGLGVWAVAGVRTVVPMFAAHQDTRTTVLASLISLIMFLALTGSLLGVFGHVAIALANSFASASQVVLLLYMLRKRHTGALGLRPVLISAGRITLASIAMAVVARVLARYFDWSHPPSELARILAYAALGAVSLATFFAAAVALRAPELGELMRAVRRKRARAT